MGSLYCVLRLAYSVFGSVYSIGKIAFWRFFVCIVEVIYANLCVKNKPEIFAFVLPPPQSVMVFNPVVIEAITSVQTRE